MGYLVLLFLVVPLVDLWVLLLIGDVIGFWPTVGLTIAIAVLGGYLGKREGKRVLAAWTRALGELRMPEEGLVSGALVLAGAVLLMTPGVITDALGLLLLIPPTRRLFARIVSARLGLWIKERSEAGQLHVRVVTRGPVAPPREPIVVEVPDEVDAPERRPDRMLN